jgi:hypothetical protein
MQLNTPILLLIFNRPVQTKEVFGKIRQCKPKYLYVAADGPRSNHADDLENCASARRLVIDSIDWSCEVKTLFRNENLGCGKAVSGAITWFFENVEEGIILEDDCSPDLSFFEFCQVLLEKYRNSEQVMMISGFSFHKKSEFKESYYFSRMSSIWGWATWKRSWQLYDFHVDHRTDFNNSFLFIEEGQVRKAFQDMLKETALGKIDTWDIQWSFAVAKNNGLGIVPLMNLVQNIGYSGAHTNQKKSKSQQIIAHTIAVDQLIHPRVVQVNQILERTSNRRIHSVVTNRGIGEKMVNGLKTTIHFAASVARKILSRHKGNIKKRLLKNGYKIFRPSIKKIVLINVFGTAFKKSVLVSHSTHPFVNGINYRHTAGAECLEIAKIFSDLGYNVDAVNYDENVSLEDIDYLKYDIIFGQGIPFETSFRTKKRGSTICYVTGNHPLFLNALALHRLNDFFIRHKVLMASSALFNEQLLPLQFGFSDQLIVWGNDFNVSTLMPHYFRGRENIHKVPAFYHQVNVPDIHGKDYVAARTNFLWFGSSRFIHRGLDLVIDIFKDMPDCTLHICGPVTYEPDFFNEYEYVLKNSPNIIVYGFIDLGSPQLKRILEKCAFTIYPSISDASSASVLTVVGNGALVPIITKNCGLDFDSFAILIGSVEEQSVREAIRKALMLSVAEIRERSLRAFEFVSQHHTVDNYRNEMRKIIQRLN